MNKSVITASKPEFNVLEGQSAIARFAVSPGLSASANVLVRVEGWGATAGSDFGSLMVSTNGRDFTPVENGVVSLPAGATEFFLAVRTLADTNAAEGIERLAFVVAQTPESAAVLDSSYYVSSVVSIVDASPVPPTITGRDQAVIEGQYAVGSFTLDGTLGTTATIRARVEGYSATLGEDTTGVMQVRVNGSGSWRDVQGNTITLEPGTERFELRVATKVDQTGEANETLNFVVEQTDALFTNSYYVNSLVTIVDSANPAGLSSVAIPGPRITSRAFNVEEGQMAASTFKLDAPLASEAMVSVRVEGHSATLGADTTGTLQFRVNGSGSWTEVPSNGVLSLPAGTASFQLRVDTVFDRIAEQPETLNFVVAQVDGSFRDSYYVSSLATIFDRGTLPAGSSSDSLGTGSSSGSSSSSTINPNDYYAPDPLAGQSSSASSGTTTTTTTTTTAAGSTGSGTSSGGMSTSAGTTGSTATTSTAATTGTGTSTTTTGTTSTTTTNTTTTASNTSTTSGATNSGPTGSGTTTAPTSPAKTFTVTESDGVIRFGGTAKGAITVLINSNGEATFSREGITFATRVANVGTKLIDSDDGEAIFNVIGTSGNDTLRFLVDHDDEELLLTGNLGTGADRVFLVMADDPDNLHTFQFNSNLSMLGADDMVGVLFTQSDDYLIFDEDSSFDGFEILLIRGDFNNVADLSLVTDESVQLIGTYVIDQFVVDGGAGLR